MSAGAKLVTRATRASRAAAVAGAIALVAGAALPWWAGSASMRLLIEFYCFVIMAQMWNLLAGYGGLVSIGQQGFLGLGGYALFALANHAGLNPFLCVPLAGLLAALVAWPSAKIVFRLRGGYFAIGTWALAEVFRLILANVSALGGGSGQSLRAMASIAKSTREPAAYLIAFAALVCALAAVYLLLRSRFGLALTAIRDSERASESQGIDTEFTKFWVYVVSAAGFGVVGAIYYMNILRISPNAAFDVSWTAYVIFIVVIGGIGTIEGPIVGTLLFFVLRETLSSYGSWYLIALGAIAVVTMLWFPAGLWGALSARFDLHLFPVRRWLRQVP
ncbi:MAG TPA: branched-chain amino acid ABC transporter permease [Burkholderiales bacterium]|nr:branched-chain amino acid ABC transporter permease [Burkholderiales bacterium]